VAATKAKLKQAVVDSSGKQHAAGTTAEVRINRHQRWQNVHVIATGIVHAIPGHGQRASAVSSP
jgi:hypothetical protein